MHNIETHTITGKKEKKLHYRVLSNAGLDLKSLKYQAVTLSL